MTAQYKLNDRYRNGKKNNYPVDGEAFGYSTSQYMYMPVRNPLEESEKMGVKVQETGKAKANGFHHAWRILEEHFDGSGGLFIDYSWAFHFSEGDPVNLPGNRMTAYNKRNYEGGAFGSYYPGKYPERELTHTINDTVHLEWDGGKTMNLIQGSRWSDIYCWAATWWDDFSDAGSKITFDYAMDYMELYPE
jgi:hypothetical protein